MASGVKIKLNHRAIAKFLKSDEVHSLLDERGARLERMLQKTNKDITVERSTGWDGRTAIDYIVEDMTSEDFTGNLVEIVLAESKLKVSTRGATSSGGSE